ncbi:MAG: DUF2269 family protein [Actinomycetota bacterium]
MLHVVGAVAGLGPVFGFTITGPMASRVGGEPALGIMQSMLKIARGIILPMAVLQGVTGVALINLGGWDVNFGSHEWLLISIVLYLAMLAVAFFIQLPTLSNLVGMAKGGSQSSADFGALQKKAAGAGSLLVLLVVVLTVLMVLKPGS